MELTTSILALFAIVAVAGLIWMLIVSESANAWHSMFESKKACENWFKAHNQTNATTNST